jgi:hypothetical protein
MFHLLKKGASSLSSKAMMNIENGSGDDTAVKARLKRIKKQVSII